MTALPKKILAVCSPSLLQLLAFFSCSALLFLQCFRRKYFGEAWAEDGSHHIPGALEDPFNLFSPVIDHLQVAGRLIAALAVHISLEYTPWMITILATLIFAYIVSYVCRPSFSWLIPNHWLRFCLAHAFALAPGNIEISGNIICMAYSLGFFGILLALEDSPKMRSLLCWLILTISTPFSALSIPLLGIRLFVRPNKVLFYALGVCICGLSLPLVLHLHTTYSASTFVLNSVKVYIVECVDVFSSFFLIYSVYGVGGADLLLQDPVSFSLSAFLIGLLFVSLFWKIPKEQKLIVAGLILTACFYCILHALGRNDYHGSPFQWKKIPPVLRNVYFSTTLSIFAWLILVSRNLYLSPERKLLLCSYLLISRGMILQAFLPLPPPNALEEIPLNGRWSNFAQKLEQVRRSGCSEDLPTPFASTYLRSKYGVLQCRCENNNILCSPQDINGTDKNYIIPQYEKP
jgi:hypothetical protein